MIKLDDIVVKFGDFEALHKISVHVKEGERVKAGQKLITFDPEKIKAAGHPLTTIMVITNSSGYENFRFDSEIDVQAGETVIAHAE